MTRTAKLGLQLCSSLILLGVPSFLGDAHELAFPRVVVSTSFASWLLIMVLVPPFIYIRYRLSVKEFLAVVAIAWGPFCVLLMLADEVVGGHQPEWLWSYHWVLLYWFIIGYSVMVIPGFLLEWLISRLGLLMANGNDARH